MIYGSDLHLRPESEDVVMPVLQELADFAVAAQDPHIGLLGDTYHLRYAIPVQLQNTLHSWLKSQVARGLRFHFLPGNHDQVDVRGRNGLEVLHDRAGVTVYVDPYFDEQARTLWLPYRKDPAELVSWYQQWLAATPPPVVASTVVHLHHGIMGAQMNDGRVAGHLEGLPAETFTAVPRVYLGHWHRHQVVANCVYVGSQWQTKSDEAGQVKGFVHAKRHGPSYTGPAYTFHQVNFGPRFVRDASLATLQSLNPGDVILGKGISEDLAAEAIRRGIVVRSAVPDQAPDAPRFQCTTLREYALQYAQKNAPPDETAALMSIFDEVAG